MRLERGVQIAIASLEPDACQHSIGCKSSRAGDGYSAYWR